ncbi:helix-turn-helix transcriptional regulator, partial [Campylobacter jejuni]|nr:helix-turn-helix transcriptional regulator [Campylobacter jejuni]
MYGTIIKQIREDKELTLAATYFGVCSKTNAIAFEQGKRMLAADKFVQVLDNLMISLEEFNWIAANYRSSEPILQEYLLKKSWNTGQLAKFEQHLQLSRQKGLNDLKLASFRLLHAYAIK